MYSPPNGPYLVGDKLEHRELRLDTTELDRGVPLRHVEQVDSLRLTMQQNTRGEQRGRRES